MTREELEFSISQYLDGTIADSERARLDEVLASDPEARQILAELRSLDALMRANAPEPQVNWDRLAEHLSAVVSGASAPAESYKIAWYRQSSVLAMAAAVLVVIGVTIHLVRHSTVREVQPVAVLQIQGPQAETSSGAAVASVSIGPASPVDENRYQLSEGIVYRPSRVSLIASDAGTGQDSGASPYR